jgi:hypothetical protein
MGRPFPTFGRDMRDRGCLYIGENHTNGANLGALAWKLMWIHSQVKAIFIEYYDSGVGPASASMSGIQAELLNSGFLGHRQSIPAEVGQLKSQCDRYGILLEGWNVANVLEGAEGKFARANELWHKNACLKLMTRLNKINGVFNYIVFGGFYHGTGLKKDGIFFQDLPAFMLNNTQFSEYKSENPQHAIWI